MRKKKVAGGENEWAEFRIESSAVRLPCQAWWTNRLPLQVNTFVCPLGCKATANHLPLSNPVLYILSCHTNWLLVLSHYVHESPLCSVDTCASFHWYTNIFTVPPLWCPNHFSPASLDLFSLWCPIAWSCPSWQLRLQHQFFHSCCYVKITH